MTALLDRMATRALVALGIAATVFVILFMVSFNERKPHALFDRQARFSYADHIALLERYPDGRFLDAGLFITCMDGKFLYLYADRTQWEWVPYAGVGCYVP